MKKIGLFLSFILILSSIFCFSACSDSGSSFDAYYFKTGIHIETHDSSIKDGTEKALRTLFINAEKQFDIKNSNSPVYAINNGNIGDAVTLSNLGTEVFKIAKDCYNLTDGLFNPSVYPLVKLWQFSPSYPVEKFTLPTDEQIRQTLNVVNFDGVSLNESNNTLTKTADGVMLDFGGILKGYVADKAGEILLNAGHKSGYVSIGGSSLYILSVESLGIIHPKKATLGKSILSVKLKGLKNLSVSTSGDYEKFYTYDNQTYSHIINPLTGYPANTNVCSVTIIGANGGFSDAITTAACLKEHLPNNINDSPLVTFLKNILTEYPDSSIYAIYDDGINKQILTNKKQGENFTPLDSEYTIINFNK